MRPNSGRYLQSIADELYSQSTRVRDLIGGAHWLSDGRHKEHLLTSLVQRHLPGSCIAAPGFVVSPGNVKECSREQDLLVVDTTIEAPLFHQGNLLIAFPSTVLAAVSVKTRLEEKYVREAVEGLNSVREVTAGYNYPCAPPLCAAFFFEERDSALDDPTTVLNYIEKALRDHAVKVDSLANSIPGPDLLATAYNLLIRFDYRTDDTIRLLPHKCDKLAAAIVISHLANHLAQCRGAAHSDFSILADSPHARISGSHVREVKVT